MNYPGDNELYIAGGDGHGKCLFKWCYEDATFEEMSSMNLNRRQYDQFISLLSDREGQGH